MTKDPKTCCNPRDVVDAIQQMIDISILLNSTNPYVGERVQKMEELELLRRKITDYLLVNSTQKGVYKDPEYEPPAIRPNP